MLEGKGMYIWQIKNVCGGNGKEAAEEAFHAGFTHVCIKILDGTQEYNQRPIYNASFEYVGWEDDILMPFIQPFKDLGILVYGWQYIYHYLPVREAEKARNRCDDLGLDGFIIDAEAHVKHKNEEAKAYSKKINQLMDGYPIYLSSYRYPHLHRELNWDAYFGCSNYVMPQVYWQGADNPGTQLTKSYDEYVELGWKDKYVPTGAAYSEHGWSATPDQVTRFMKTAEELGLPAVNFYRWQEAWNIPGMWQAISDYDYGNNGGNGDPDPDPEMERIVLEISGRDLAVKQIVDNGLISVLPIVSK